MNPLITQLASEVWAMEPRRVEQLLSELARMSASAEAMAARAQFSDDDENAGPGYENRAGVAVLPVKGYILKQSSPLLNWWGVEHTGMRDMSAALDRALADPSVRAVHLDIDSPGGTVTGVDEMAAKLHAAGAVKPVTAHAPDLAASAAYYLGAQASRLTAGSSAAVGSIGTYTVVYDTSRLFEDAGIKAHVVSSHELKGTGVMGSKVTDAQLADIRRNIDSYNGLFKAAVGRGRQMTPAQVEAVATGQVWIGSESQANGLVDGIMTADEALAHAVSAANPNPAMQPHAPTVARSQESTMGETVQAPKGQEAATVSGAAAPTAEAKEMAEKLAAEKAAREKAEVQLSILRKAQMSELIDQAAAEGRVTPAMRAEVEKFAGMLTDPAELRSFLGQLKPQTSPKRVSADAPAADAKPVPSEGEKQVAKWLETTPEQVEKYADVKGYRNNGTFELTDGRIVTRAELKRLKGIAAAALVGLAVLFGAGTPDVANAAPLSAARQTQSKNTGAIKSYLMKASTAIYAGGLVMLDSNGLAVPASAEASNKGVVGVATESKTSAAAGSYYIKAQEGWFKMAGTTLAQTSTGLFVYAEDDQTVDETRDATQPLAGVLIEYVSASVAWVWVSPIFAPLGEIGNFTGKNLGYVSNTTDGSITLGEASEDMSFAFAANSVALASTTGVVGFDLGAVGTTLTFANDQTLNTGTNNAFIFGDNNEDLSLTFGANLVTLASSTGVVALDMGAISTTLTFAQGQTLATGVDNALTFGDNAEDLTLTFAANSVALSSSTGVVDLDVGAVQLTSSAANDFGWAIVAAGNQACNTTCTHACVFGFDDGAADAETVVACTDATADKCLCAGAN